MAHVVVARSEAVRGEQFFQVLAQRGGFTGEVGAGLFGSTVRHQATSSSDVDVWVDLDPLTPYAAVHLKQELEALLQRPVDLVRLRDRTNPALRRALLQEGIRA